MKVIDADGVITGSFFDIIPVNYDEYTKEKLNNIDNIVRVFQQHHIEDINLAVISEFLDIEMPCVRMEKATDKTFLFIVERHVEAAEREIDGQRIKFGKTTKYITVYKEAVHDIHNAKKIAPKQYLQKSYLETLDEKYFTEDIYTHILNFGYVTTAQCAAYFIADKIRERIIEPYINTLPNLAEARAMIARLDVFIRNRILNGHQQIKGSTPEKFFAMLDEHIEEFIRIKDGEMIGREQYALVTVTQAISDTALAAGISPKKHAENVLKQQRVMLKNDNLHILGVTTTDLQTLFIDAVGMLLCTYGEWDSKQKVSTCQIDGNKFLQGFNVALTDINRNAVFSYLRDEVSTIRLLVECDNGYLDRQAFMIDREVTQDDLHKTKTDRWTFTGRPDTYQLHFAKKNSKNYFKVYSKVITKTFAILPMKKQVSVVTVDDKKKKHYKLEPCYNGLYNVLHNLQIDLAKTSHIDKPLSYYGYDESKDDKHHSTLKAILDAINTIPNSLECYRHALPQGDKTKEEWKKKQIWERKPYYIRGAFNSVQKELHEKSEKDNAAKAEKKHKEQGQKK